MAVKRVPANKGKRYSATVLTASEFKRLLAQIDGDSATAIRNRALILTIYRGALRVAEGLSLRPADVDLDSGRLHVRNGKGSRSRTVGLDGGALKALERWMAKRDELGWGDGAYLFGALYSRSGAEPGGELHPAYLRRLLPKLADKAGIDKRVHPHMLRHTRAHELSAEGVPVSVIQKALGHRSIGTTSTYLDHVSAADVVAAMGGKRGRRD
jgi:integrase